ncbi:class I SAM-dependent methyltransferase [bacterium]|nr:class I SAM-dependent methyltransferase [bacterium]
MNRKEFFDRMASDWEKEHRCQKEQAKLEKLAGYFPLSQGHWVLDAGCGTGRLIPFIRKSIGTQGSLVEMDFSREMLKIGQEKYFSENTGFVQSNAQTIPLQNDNFDVVICFALFPHLSQKEKALKEFRRVLKPQSPLVIAHPMSREELNRFHSHVKGPVAQDFLPDRREMEQLFSAARFHNLSIKDEPSLYIAQATA